MNIFKYEIKQYRKSIIIWSVAFVLFVSCFMLMAPIFLEESSAMKDIILGFGEAITKSMNIDIDTFFSEVGFYSYIFTYITLMASIQAMNLGLGIFSKENRMKTADFLMTKPKSRKKIFFSKLIATITVLAITEAAFYISAYLSILFISNGNFVLMPFILISLSLTFIHLIFLFLGIFLAMIMPKVKSVITISMGFTFGFFLMGMINAIVDSKILHFFAPLRYFDSNYIMLNKSYDLTYVFLSIGVILVLAIASYLIYLKKDIDAV